MREVIINPNSYGFHQKKQFFEGQSWTGIRYDPENLQLCEKSIKTKSVEGNQQGTFLHFPLPS